MSNTEPTRVESSGTNKRYWSGTHRIVAPEVTLNAITPHVRGMGITRVADITGLDVIGIPVVAVVRPNSRSVSVAQGKGLDLASAKVSGLMEAVENYHAERIQAPLVLASATELRERGPVLDLEGLARAEGGAFDPTLPILWIAGHDALKRRAVWLPFEVVHTNYTMPLPTGSGAFLMSDSGVASGNHPLEATSHAICELVERDAVTLWHFLDRAERQARRIALDSVDDDRCRWLLERFAVARVNAAIWDVTSDIGIPAFYCGIVDDETSPWRTLTPAFGSGCHPCREVALARALTEAAQTRLTLIAGTRDDIGIAAYRRDVDRDEVREARALFGLRASRPLTEVPTRVSEAVDEDVAWELDCLRRVGIEEVAIVDLTLPEYRIPVVRVVIPGLEAAHGAAGFVAGRRLRARLA